ncbi:MAG: amino acid ABC transporter permease [Nocardiopsis sp. BM-2018]|uniref:Polar amino acid transport system permease protein n=1 Tax=Nocardiopsis metallicus TaxID=179819 RepID=A0A840WB15_9ACTN|nr:MULTISPECIES: amino acid ABC transporter permease [Nocardiopsis]MBB5492593.1 polar amino acid transport system permease protein [Nocardiopsis metallicus]QRN80583.1 MAG: amino acid ABC transporter permease [Nocardiopsis sp. BM-2018]
MTSPSASADDPGSKEPTRSRSADPITAVPVRYPERWVAAGIVLVLAAMFVNMLITNPAFNWPFMFDHMFSDPVLRGVWVTLSATILAMIIGILLGVILAIMRLSGNPVLVSVSWMYTWFFRGVPRLVLAVLFGNIAILYSTIHIGLPFDNYWMPWLGLEGDARFFEIDVRTLLSGYMAGLLALALSEGAYMAEIIRAGLQSVNKGQTEAAQALGMSRSKIMRRITLPQAMRVVIPPTGNETIAMLKDTALLAYVPVTIELFYQLQAVGTRTYQIFPMLVAACLWYLAITSVLMVGQYFIERRFSRSERGVRDRIVGGAH